MGYVTQGGAPINLSASGAISLCPGTMIGYHVNSTSGGTIILKDGGASGTAVTGTITPGLGFQAFPATFRSSSGAYATLANTIDVTFFFQAG